MTKKTALPAGIRSLVSRVEKARELTSAMARDFLEASEITASELEGWSNFGHSKAESYGAMQVWDGGFFELYVLSWIDGDMSAIHDHGRFEWGAVRTCGEAEHAVFRKKDGVLSTQDRRACPPGSVLAMAQDLIHQMGNVGQEPFLTLHLLGRDGRDASVTGKTRIYDLDGDEVRFTDGGAFFDLPDSEVTGRAAGPKADFPTYLRHQVELLKRCMVRDDVLTRRRWRSWRQERLAAELFAAATWRRFSDEWNRMNAEARLRLGHYSRILYQELAAAAALQKILIDAGLAEAAFDVVRLDELLAFSDLERFADGYLELVADTYSLGLSSLAAA